MHTILWGILLNKNIASRCIVISTIGLMYENAGKNEHKK